MHDCHGGVELSCLKKPVLVPFSNGGSVKSNKVHTAQSFGFAYSHNLHVICEIEYGDNLHTIN